jgi:hypothetical protein
MSLLMVHIDPIMTAFQQFIDFARSATLANRNTLWQQILEEAGPKPQ